MSPKSKQKSPESELAALAAEIREHDRRYYLLDSPAIADTEYDRLMSRLKELEAAHPDLASPDSPTRRVSGGVGSDFKPVKHAVPMLSLDNAYEEADVLAWDERVRKNLPPGEAPSYLVEPKSPYLS